MRKFNIQLFENDARYQYYKTSSSRGYDHRRGGMWFERMKTAHKDHILRLISK